MLSQVRRDPAMRFLGRGTAFVFVGALFVLNVAAFVRAKAADGGISELAGYNIAMTLGIWIPVLALLAIAAFDRRVSRFDMASPIEAASLWTSHSVAVALAALAALAATSGAAWLVETGVDALVGGSGPRLGPELGLLAFRLACITVFLTVASQSIEPSLSRLSLQARHAFPVVLMLIGGVALVPLLGLVHPLVALALPALAAAIALGVRSRLDRTFRLAPWHGLLGPRAAPASRSADAADRAAAWANVGSARPSRLVVVKTVLRTITKMPLMPIVGAPILVAFGALLSGVLRASRGGGGVRFTMIALTAYMLFAFVGYPPRRLYLLDGFPISRRAVFAAIVFLPVVLLSAGYGAGRLGADALAGGRELIDFVEIEGQRVTRVPIEYCEISWSGDVPPPDSPWGESVGSSWSREVIRGWRPRVYSPFGIDDGSSIDFIALQLSRAVEAVYGERIEPEEVRQRYLELSPDAGVLPKPGGLTVRGDHPEFRPRPRGPVFPFLMLVSGVLWFLAMLPYFRSLRADTTERGRKSVYWVAMLGLLGLHFVLYGLLMTGRTSTLVIVGFSEILLANVGEALPGGAFTAWILSALVLAVFYRIAERQFLRIESSVGDDRFGGLLGGAV